jgi:hypothetical protein
MAFDSKCYELAEYFLPSGLPNGRLREELAQHIQEAVEDWLNGERDRLATALDKPSN